MNQEKKLIDLIQNFDTAMLTTKSADGRLDSRPMAIAECTDQGKLWFVTDSGAGKVAEIEQDHEVAVTMQSRNQFVALSGVARTVDDPAKVKALWQKSWEVWFPKGPSDPSVLLLHVDSRAGEYWDNSGTEGLRYLVKAGAAYVQGERPTTDDSINASVSL